MFIYSSIIYIETMTKIMTKIMTETTRQEAIQ